MSTCSGKTSLVRGGSKVRMKRLYPRWRALSVLRQKGYTDVYVTVRPSTFAVFCNSYDADWWRKQELLFSKAGCENELSEPVLNCALCTQSAKIYSGLYRPELKMFRLAQWAPWWPLLLTETMPSTVTRWCKNSWPHFPKPALKKTIMSPMVKK